MPSTVRLAAAFTALLLSRGGAVAQLPTAPMPHLSLDGLVGEYKRFGLPLPPPDAEFVRLKHYNSRPDEPYLLGFRIPAKPGEDAPCLVGSEYLWPALVEPAKPDLAALRGIEHTYTSDLLCLAAQCRLRRWDELAEFLYLWGRDAIENPGPARVAVVKGVPLHLGGWRLRVWDWRNRSVAEELRLTAYAYWHPRITRADGDRTEVLRYLKEAVPGGDPDIRDLERTVAPRKSKPGTVESLIDDLTEYSAGSRFGLFSGGEWGDATSRRLAELGFDAVPALLDHLEDWRFTRSADPGRFELGRSRSGSVTWRAGSWTTCPTGNSGTASSSAGWPTRRRRASGGRPPGRSGKNVGWPSTR